VSTDEKTPGELRDEQTHKARAAEERRQANVEKAVATANRTELGKLGGPELNPGNPGHDPVTGEPV
jgi:hypothetical protein